MRSVSLAASESRLPQAVASFVGRQQRTRSYSSAPSTAPASESGRHRWNRLDASGALLEVQERHGHSVTETLVSAVNQQRAATRPITLETLTEYEAVQLFIERARVADSTFEVTDRNASAVALLCRSLDGSPLADLDAQDGRGSPLLGPVRFSPRSPKAARTGRAGSPGEALVTSEWDGRSRA